MHTHGRGDARMTAAQAMPESAGCVGYAVTRAWRPHDQPQGHVICQCALAPWYPVCVRVTSTVPLPAQGRCWWLGMAAARVLRIDKQQPCAAAGVALERAVGPLVMKRTHWRPRCERAGARKVSLGLVVWSKCACGSTQPTHTAASGMACTAGMRAAFHALCAHRFQGAHSRSDVLGFACTHDAAPPRAEPTPTAQCDEGPATAARLRARDRLAHGLGQRCGARLPAAAQRPGRAHAGRAAGRAGRRIPRPALAGPPRRLRSGLARGKRPRLAAAGAPRMARARGRAGGRVCGRAGGRERAARGRLRMVQDGGDRVGGQRADSRRGRPLRGRARHGRRAAAACGAA